MQKKNLELKSIVFYSKELGMDYNLSNHQSYIDGWTKDLEDKKTEIYEAVKDSFKII